MKYFSLHECRSIVSITLVISLSNSYAFKETLRRRHVVLNPPAFDFSQNETKCESNSDCEDNDKCTINICSDGICTSELNCEQCGKAEVKVNIHTDLYPQETSWEIIQSVSHDTYLASPIMAGGQYQLPNILYSDAKCFDHGLYTFIITDVDGFCCTFGTGNYTLLVNDEKLASGGDFSQVEETTFNITADGTSSPTGTLVPTIIDSLAPTATSSTDIFSTNGTIPTKTPIIQTCDSSSDCEDNDACTINICSDGICTYELNCEQCGKADVKVDIQTDLDPQETSWEIIQSVSQGTYLSSPIMIGGPYQSPNTLFSDTKCFDHGTYTFIIMDVDGICCSYGSGSYSLFINDEELASGGDFSQVEETTFNITADEISSPTDKLVPTITDSLEPTVTASTDILFPNETIPTKIPIQTCDSSSDCEDNDTCTINICSDGICTYELNCEQCGKADVKVDIQTDLDPQETSWEIIQSVSQGTYLSSPIMIGGPYQSPNTLFSDTKCFDHGTYTFIIMDVDGICCSFGSGSYSLFINDKEMASGGDFSQVEETTFNITADEISSPIDKLVPSITDSLTPTATASTDIFLTNDTIPTKTPIIQTCDSSSDCEDNDMCTINICSDRICTSYLNCEQCGKVEVKVDVHTDLYPQETSWEIIQSVSQGTYLASKNMEGGPYELANTLFSDTKCFDHGTYTLIMMDVDGICCSFGSGSYTLYVNDKALASGGDFSQVEEATFNITINEVTSTPTISPINYNSPLSLPSKNLPTLPTMFPTHILPTIFPTHSNPTPYPTEIPPTPYPTEIPPTPYPSTFR